MNSHTNVFGVLGRPLCYHRRGLFVCVSGIARSSGRNSVGLHDVSFRYSGHGCFEYMKCFCTAYRRELVAVSKVSCFPFLNCFGSFLLDIIFLPSLPPRTMYSLLFALRSSPIHSAKKSDLLLTQAINLSRLG